ADLDDRGTIGARAHEIEPDLRALARPGGGADPDGQAHLGFVGGLGLWRRRHGERSEGACGSAKHGSAVPLGCFLVCWRHKWRGRHRASTGKGMRSSSTAKTATSSHVTQRKVLSMGTSAMRHDTMRLTARRGVNCPSATMMLRITPNQTGSHP